MPNTHRVKPGRCVQRDTGQMIQGGSEFTPSGTEFARFGIDIEELEPRLFARPGARDLPLVETPAPRRKSRKKAGTGANA